MVSLETILKAEYVGDIFSNDKHRVKNEYKELSKRWHPDLNGNSEDSNKAMQKINLLYSKAQKLLDEGKWEKENYVCLKAIDGREFEINYKKVYQFELGVFYVLSKSIVYVIDKKYSVLYNNYKSILKSLKYPNDKMKTEFEMLLPKINLEFETTDSFVMRIDKPDDVFSMIDIQKFYKGNVPDRHVAWMVNRLYNLECFLAYNGITHNALTIENLFVVPDRHGVLVYGGWWFAQKLGSKLTGVPRKIYNIMSYEDKTSGTANPTIDLETIRLVARQLLGDEYGGKIMNNKDIPTPIKEWVLGKSGKNALKEYQEWNETIDASYGKRVFIKMEINKNNIYD